MKLLIRAGLVNKSIRHRGGCCKNPDKTNGPINNWSGRIAIINLYNIGRSAAPAPRTGGIYRNFVNRDHTSTR